MNERRDVCHAAGTVDLLFAMVGREAAALRDNHFTLHDVLNCITTHNASPSVVSASVDTPKCKPFNYFFSPSGRSHFLAMTSLLVIDCVFELIRSSSWLKKRSKRPCGSGGLRE